MNQIMYIQAAVAISPQNTFEEDAFLQPVVASDNGKLYTLNHDYTPYINPVAIRRMSRILKMSIATAMQCLKKAGVKTPDAIITGTGRGSMNDTERFLNDMIDLNEGALPPTNFIQSTYNSPNGWIALQTQSTTYNQTYVHRGSSLELSLLDAQLLLDEAGGNPQNILVGCFDEMTDEYYIVKSNIGYWKKPEINSLQLHAYNTTNGTIAGEGTAFFTLSNVKGNAIAAIQSLKLLQQIANDTDIIASIHQMLIEQGITFNDISLVMLGNNGDIRQEHYYEGIEQLCSAHNTTTVAFKHLCGEYDTSTGFGIWLANYIIANNQIPAAIIKKQGVHRPLQYILLVNHYILGSASVILLSKA